MQLMYLQTFTIFSGGKYLSLIHISEPTRPERISYAVFCLKKKNKKLHFYLLNTQCNFHLLSLVFSLVPYMVWNKSVHNLSLLGDWQSYPCKYNINFTEGNCFPILLLQCNWCICKLLPSFQVESTVAPSSAWCSRQQLVCKEILLLSL